MDGNLSLHVGISLCIPNQKNEMNYFGGRFDKSLSVDQHIIKAPAKLQKLSSAFFESNII